ncbi:hypothetical protein CMV_020133 [Castanea mollissima]|uniref:Uncharacterized protein n=1 Tax=Castanea mollissima TaxID=60419 RepID=A0A8J4VG20_9ROSI|nr:hypothetical protein CMV_020133 [Castanea mollissima]
MSSSSRIPFAFHQLQSTVHELSRFPSPNKIFHSPSPVNTDLFHYFVLCYSFSSLSFSRFKCNRWCLQMSFFSVMIVVEKEEVVEEEEKEEEDACDDYDGAVLFIDYGDNDEGGIYYNESPEDAVDDDSDDKRLIVGLKVVNIEEGSSLLLGGECGVAC